LLQRHTITGCQGTGSAFKAVAPGTIVHNSAVVSSRV